MRVSPLQPKGHVFQEVSIQMEVDADNNPVPAVGFDFAGVRILCDVGHADVEENDSQPTEDSMLVSLHLRIPNEEGTKCPYKVSVAVTGIFKWLKKETKREERRDLTVVNGATILYGAIREMVMAITARSVSGQMLLPSVNFEDNRPSLEKPKHSAAQVQ
jgi:hypothetical protein